MIEIQDSQFMNLIHQLRISFLRLGLYIDIILRLEIVQKLVGLIIYWLYIKPYN